MTTDPLAPGLWRPQWPVPEGVGVLLTDRQGGVSQPPFNDFNLAQHVNDEAGAVAANRERLQTALGDVGVQWLEQVHGTKVVTAEANGRVKTADAAISREPGVACAILTADCLPVLLCDRQASVVAAAHAGWRGLVNGVLANTVQAMAVPASEITAYLGPAISQLHFEVGIEVVEAVFALAQSDADVQALSAAIKPGQRPMHFYVDLYAVARVHLAGLGVTQVYGGNCCTFADERFYSYRQQKITGRQAALIWLSR